MLVQTTRYATPATKPFAWSYSRLKNYEACPKRHYHVDIKKEFREDDSDNEAMLWGNRVHAMLAARIGKGTALEPIHQEFEPWAAKILSGPGKVLVEQELAITEDFKPCTWFGREAWFRAKADVIKLNGPVGIVIDWKTGKIIEDSVQLALTAACMFVHYPELQRVRSMYVWLKENADTILDINRDELPSLWGNLWSRIEQLKLAHNTTDYPPSPSYLCRRFCPVKTCPHHGEDHRK